MIYGSLLHPVLLVCVASVLTPLDIETQTSNVVSCSNIKRCLACL